MRKCKEERKVRRGITKVDNDRSVRETGLRRCNDADPTRVGLSRPGLAWQTSSLARSLARARSARLHVCMFCTCARVLAGLLRMHVCNCGIPRLANSETSTTRRGDGEEVGLARLDRVSTWHYLLKRRKRTRVHVCTRRTRESADRYARRARSRSHFRSARFAQVRRHLAERSRRAGVLLRSALMRRGTMGNVKILSLHLATDN